MRIGILAFPGVQLLDVVGPADVFAEAARQLGSPRAYAIKVIGTGLLDGRRVVTHWNSVGRLAAEYPRANVEPDAIYVKDGKLYTSAGVSAGMDLALAMVAEDHGRALALRVAREMVMFLQRPGGQSQLSAFLAAQAAEKSEIREVQDYVLAHLDADLSVPTLAARARMSERNFARVFRAESGMTPAAFVEKARIDTARRLMERREVPIKRLAANIGYANADAFRRAFVRRMGVAPREYQRQFDT